MVSLEVGAVWKGRPLRSDPAEDPALGERTRIGHDEPCQEPVGRGIDPAVVPLVNQPFRERPSGSHVERGVLKTDELSSKMLKRRLCHYGDHNEGLTAIRTPASSGGPALEEPTSLPLR